ncbi:MAG: hypothetical protein NXI30_04060 [bacterium]|nr:hypothetical protein [bacterium]
MAARRSTDVNEQITLRRWAAYDYHDPAVVLGKLRSVQLAFDLSEVPGDIANLRTRGLAVHREARDAAFFTLGIASRLGLTVGYAPVEDDDYDFVTVVKHDDGDLFAAVQLKELPPDELNPGITLQALLETAATRYSGTERTILAVHVNRVGTLNYGALQLPDMPFAEVYLFGSTEPDQSRWVLIGDLTGDVEVTYFDHPEPIPLR